MAGRIEDYGLIGDRRTSALVGRDGSIDWLCWPRFDSGGCFAALLGTPEHGFWRIGPHDGRSSTSRRYRDGSLILETDFETPEGSFRLTDCMPLQPGPSRLLRRVTGLTGRVACRSDIRIRFDYGAAVPWVTRLPDGAGLRAVAGPDMVVIRSTVAHRGVDRASVAEFTIAAGESIPFELIYAASYDPLPEAGDVEAMIESTDQAWRDWSDRCRPAGRWTEAVRRSAITLKALTYAPTGGIVAAPTTSLPEEIGGERNWDYRICWLRDASLTLMALLSAGYREEASDWRDWLMRAAMGSPSQIQVMYGLAGERLLHEWELPWLPGYEDSTPVRVGNGAAGQLQLDVFGQMLDTLHQARRHEISFSEDAWSLERALVGQMEKVWKLPDSGIWEIRSAPEHFVHSKVMAWVAVDRAVRDIEAFGLDGPLKEWRALRGRIHADVCAHGYDAQLGSFVRAYGSKTVDASLLLLPAMGFLPPDDPRIRGTVAAIERQLLIGRLVRRYDTHAEDDGLPPGEAAFLPCAFWLADAYSMDGRHADAEALYDYLLGLRNDLGLMAEEYDPVRQRQLGNFPQAFSHVALINTAYTLRDRAPEPRHAGAPAGPDPQAKREVEAD